jgi:hypothetical protein
MEKNENRKELAKKYGMEFGREVFEALFILCLINIIQVFSSSPNPNPNPNPIGAAVNSFQTQKGLFQLPWRNIVMWSLVLGAFTTVTHLLDNDMHVRLKDGMKNSVGGVVISSAIARR